jgi:hypothetical protein
MAVTMLVVSLLAIAVVVINSVYRIIDFKRNKDGIPATV